MRPRSFFLWRAALLAILLLTTLQCRLRSPTVSTPSETVAGTVVTKTPGAVSWPSTGTATLPAASATAVPSATVAKPTIDASATPLPTATATATATVTVTPLPHPLYCAEPPDDYGRVDVRGHALSERTLAMLRVAQQIYEGPGDLMRITQGSYRDVVQASFGTHAGGGAVDISIRDPRKESVFLWEEAEPMVMALRYEGFAAWFRDVGDIGENSPAHIHAIAVGDVELSHAAQEQVTGAGGYLAGMDGLIAPYGPNADRHGGPVICSWME